MNHHALLERRRLERRLERHVDGVLAGDVLDGFSGERFGGLGDILDHGGSFIERRRGRGIICWRILTARALERSRLAEQHVEILILGAALGRELPGRDAGVDFAGRALRFSGDKGLEGKPWTLLAGSTDARFLAKFAAWL